MDPNQLSQVLFNAQSPDLNVRTHAEKWLQDAEKANYSLYAQMLAHELTSNEKQPEIRQLAGLVLKNTLTSKDDSHRSQQFQKWLQTDPTIRNGIKMGVIQTLAVPHKDVRKSAAQVASKIAQIELPKGQWPDLIQILLKNMEMENDNLKQATLETIGYICEEIDESVLTSQANHILTAVWRGINNPNNEVKLAGCIALYNSLEFVKGNFEKEVERNHIMQVVIDAAASTDLDVRVASFECLVKIASLYYDKLHSYMQKLFVLTLEAIKKDNEKVAQQGVEFWSTICDEEIFLAEEAEEAEAEKRQPERPSQHFIRGVLKFLIPILTECLTKQDDEPDEDWNVAMAAGTCLSLVAATVGDEIVAHVMPFITSSINSENWKFREAATLAFGAILEGPKQFIPQLISQAMPVLLAHMKDPVPYVKDTTAWTLGRICNLHPGAVEQFIPALVNELLQSLDDVPRVAANVCWTIHNLSEAYEEDSGKQTSGMSPMFQPLLEKLMRTSDREDSDENNLRASAYEAINTLILCSAQDANQLVFQATPLFLQRLEKTFSMQIVSSDDREQQLELQSLLCGVIQTIVQKLGNLIAPQSDRMMTLLLQVFSSRNASVHEEALMAVGAIANAVEGEFEKYMSHFRPFLITGLRNYEEHSVCAIAVGVVGDVSRALGPKLTPYCDEIVSLLLQDLQNPQMHRTVKPPILACFGDIALAIGGQFVKYLGVVMNMLNQASLTNVDQNDADLVDYLAQLRESIFDSYTGIVQGLRGDNAADPHLIPFVQNIVQFCGIISADVNRTENIVRLALGVLGDLGQALGSKVKQPLTQPFVKQLISEGMKGEEQSTKESAQWAKEVITKL